jgi:hypothetical protein
MPHDHRDEKVQTASTVRNPLPNPELGHVTLVPTELVPVRGLSPIESLRLALRRADTTAEPHASAQNTDETQAKMRDAE